MSFGFGFGFPKNYVAALFTPRQLFTAGINGAWYDPSDITTLFQDAAGTTPVTAVGQPVGLMLDKSKGLVLGPEQFPSYDFTNWGAAGGLSSRTATSFTTTSNGGVTKAIPSGSGKTYQIRITGTTSVTLIVRNSSNLDGAATINAGTFDVTITSPACFAAAITLYLALTGAGTATITTLSVRELPGNHAYNPSGNSANFPVLQARYNLLTKTEDFSDAVWSKSISGTGTLPVVNSNSATDPNGGNTADIVSFNIGSGTTLSDVSALEYSISVSAGVQYRGGVYLKAATPGDVGKSVLLRHAAATAGAVIVLTDSWQRFSSNENAFGTGTTAFRIGVRGTATSNSVSVALWGADLRVANDALNQPSYQRVNTATDYDTVGFKPYLALNGVNQWLQTNSIDFTYGDKMFVSAGVRKLSDAAFGAIAELSASADANNGSFVVGCNTLNGDNPSRRTWAARVQGTSGNLGGASVFASPDTRVITSVLDIGAATPSTENIMRINGVSQTLTYAPSDAGTGNFGNYPLYIGARAGTSLFFNGRLYGLVVAGKAASASEIDSTGAWMNQKTGAY